jgi:hypothetical protein
MSFSLSPSPHPTILETTLPNSSGCLVDSSYSFSQISGWPRPYLPSGHWRTCRGGGRSDETPAIKLFISHRFRLHPTLHLPTGFSRSFIIFSLTSYHHLIHLHMHLLSTPSILALAFSGTHDSQLWHLPAFISDSSYSLSYSSRSLYSASPSCHHDMFKHAIASEKAAAIALFISHDFRLDRTLHPPGFLSHSFIIISLTL